MKIYINRNCSGFHWFEGDFSANEEILKMNYAKPVPENMERLKKVMLYTQHELCLAYENGMYILSLNNIPEIERKDSYGRPLSMQLVLVDENIGLLWKILFYRLQQFENFSKEMSDCFASVLVADPPYVRCKKTLLENLFNSCSKKELSEDAKKIISGTTGRLLFVNDESRTTMKNVGFLENEILKAEHSLKQCEHIQWLIEPTLGPDPIRILKEENERLRKENEDLKNEIESLKTKSPDEIKNLIDKLEISENALVQERLSNEILRGVNKKQQEQIEQYAKKIEELMGAQNPSEKTLFERIEVLERKLNEFELKNASLLEDKTEKRKLIEEKNRNILRLKLLSIGLGIVSILLLSLYLIK